MAHLQINAEQIKRDLLARCDAYCAATGTGMTILSISLTGSPSYLGFLKGGRRNITLDMAERIQNGLNKLERTMELITYGKAIKIRTRERHRRESAAVY